MRLADTAKAVCVFTFPASKGARLAHYLIYSYSSSKKKIENKSTFSFSSSRNVLFNKILNRFEY